MSSSRTIVFFCVLLAVSPVAAQFVGRSVTGEAMAVEAARSARVDSHVTVIGSIASHLRGEYHVFRDDTGKIRVEIPDELWAGRQVSPEDTVRLRAEVDRRLIGEVYLWVQSLEIVGP